MQDMRHLAIRTVLKDFHQERNSSENRDGGSNRREHFCPPIQGQHV